jgi:hypothetical protein
VKNLNFVAASFVGARVRLLAQQFFHKSYTEIMTRIIMQYPFFDSSDGKKGHSMIMDKI